MTDSDWIKLRLPPNASFSKNGVTYTLANAVTDALTAEPVKETALADLLEILASAQMYTSEVMGDYQYSGPKLLEMAKYWRSVGANGGTRPGSFTSVPAIFETSCGDEYSTECDND